MDLVESEISNENSARHPWEEARYQVVLDLIKGINGSEKSSSFEILDIGCGDVWLIEQLSNELENARFTAVDTAFTAELIQKYRKKLDPTRFKIHSELEEAVQETEKVDLVLLLDVIEHIENEVDFLKESIERSASIGSETSFLITVPAFQSLYCAHDDFLKHYRRYTKRSLRHALESAGLEVEYSGYYFSSLLLPRLLIKLLEKLGLKKEEVQGIGGHQKSWVDPIIKNTLIFDYKLGSWMRKIGLSIAGLSVFAIARPKVRSQEIKDE